MLVLLDVALYSSSPLKHCEYINIVYPGDAFTQYPTLRGTAIVEGIQESIKMFQEAGSYSCNSVSSEIPSVSPAHRPQIRLISS